MGLRNMTSVALVLLAVLLFGGCQNAIPTVTKMSSVPGLTLIPAKDSRNFLQVNSAGVKQQWSGGLSDGYKGNLRISQPLAEMRGTSASGYHMSGTVSLAK